MDKSYVSFSLVNFITISLYVLAALALLAGVHKLLGKGAAKPAEAK